MYHLFLLNTNGTFKFAFYKQQASAIPFPKYLQDANKQVLQVRPKQIYGKVCVA